MTKTITSLIFCLLLVSSTLEAQQVVTGRVTDRYDGTPIPDATVFIAHTTIGTQSDRYGNFSITVPIQGNFIIVVSHIGFESASRTINTPQPAHQIDFRLQKNILEEVVVNPCLPHRNRDESLFWQLLLGERPSNRGMQVLNREVVRFCLLPMGILRVFADEPIEIVNHQMGYHISYVLHRFEHNYSTGDTRINGMFFFSELSPRNERERSNWERRRQIAYSVSFTRFIRALYQEQLHERGFLLVKTDPMDPNRLTALSSRQIFDERSGLERQLFTEEEFRRLQGGSGFAAFSYSDILQRDAEGVTFTIRQPTFLAFTSTPVTNITEEPHEMLFGRGATFPLIQLLPLNITIYPDGSYSGLVHFNELRDTVLGLRAKLPIEFGVNENAVEVLRAPLRRR